MGMFDISEETEREYTQKFLAIAQERVDEPVLAMGPFRRGGAASSFAISKGQLGGLVYAANALRNKQKADGLPQQAFLVVTPTKVHAFKYKLRGRSYKLGEEVAVWDRPGLRVSTQQKLGLTMLTIESPAEGAKVTLAPGGVKDDPWTREVTRVLQENVTQVPGA